MNTQALINLQLSDMQSIWKLEHRHDADTKCVLKLLEDARMELLDVKRKLEDLQRINPASHLRLEGRKPYGSKSGEMNVVDKILRWRRDNRSFNEIAKTLNEQGHTTQTGKQWRSQQVSDIWDRYRDINNSPLSDKSIENEL